MIPIEDISGLDFVELDGMKLDGLLSRADNGGECYAEKRIIQTGI